MFECVAEEKKLDILVNNAGASWIAERKTVDGFESIFATNHLGMRLYISVDGYRYHFCLKLQLKFCWYVVC